MSELVICAPNDHKPVRIRKSGTSLIANCETCHIRMAQRVEFGYKMWRAKPRHGWREPLK